MRKIPNFVLLRAFEAAARLESFTLAAQELHLTPSAISHQIKELEEYFGRKLFERQNRKVEPTAEGLRLYDSIARVFDAVAAACAEVSLAPKAQVLAVHCAPTLAGKWLGPKLPLFLQAYPSITIRLTTGAELIDLTRVKQVDVSITYGSALTRAGIVNVGLGPERIAPLCAPSMLNPALSAADQLCSVPLIDSQLSRVTWADWFRMNSLVLPDASRPSFDRAALAIAAAADGMGVALESTRLAERELARGDLVEVGGDVFEPLDRVTHFLCYRANEENSEKVSSFRQWLLEQAGGVGVLN